MSKLPHKQLRETDAWAQELEDRIVKLEALVLPPVSKQKAKLEPVKALAKASLKPSKKSK